jgi:RNA polymerase sigma factor (sigma-70 family)
MPANDSVTNWVRRLPEKDAAAAQQLFERYWQRLVGLARRKLKTSRRVADEEDVALSAFASFCRGAEQGRFPLLTDRDNLWRLLAVITARKAYQQDLRLGRKKRGGDAAFIADGFEDFSLERLISNQPTPELAAAFAEEFERLHQSLPDDGLRAVVQAKMEGFTNEEIALRLDCALSTVERRLRTIRKLWLAEGSP